MAMKTRLKLILKAGSTVVAESQDPLLWQSALAAITGGTQGEEPLERGGAGATIPASGKPPVGSTPRIASPELRSFCRMVQVPTGAAQAALEPSRKAPFLRLHPDQYASFRMHVPQRGPNAITGTVLAATLLTLWFKFAKLGSPSVYQVKTLLKPLGVEDRNSYRSLKNCSWLTTRDGHIHLHPIRTADAFRIARAFIENTSVYTDS